jgi:hypothetical protein
MIEYTVKVEPNGDKFWRLKGKLHCEHGPAVEWADGSKYWYLNVKDIEKMGQLLNGLMVLRLGF